MSAILFGNYFATLERVVKTIPGGLKNKILFTPVENLVNFGGMHPAYNGVHTLTLGAIPWSVASMPDPNKSYSCRNDREAGGDFVTSEVKGTLPFLHQQNSYHVTRMKHHRFIVLIPLRDGKTRILGTPENGAYFDFEESTGDRGSAVPVINIAFRWKSEDSAPFFEDGPPVI